MFRTREKESCYQSPADPVRVAVDVPHKSKWNGSSFLKVEEINTNSLYSITFNPVEQPCFVKLNGLKQWLNGMIRLVNSLKYCYVRLFTEIAPTAHWHFHGFIQIYDPFKFTIFDAPRFQACGHTNIDRIGNEEDYYDDFAAWTQYCLKQQHQVRAFLNEELYFEMDEGIEPDQFFCISTFNKKKRKMPLNMVYNQDLGWIPNNRDKNEV